jgi:hypothetical protein
MQFRVFLYILDMDRLGGLAFCFGLFLITLRALLSLT